MKDEVLLWIHNAVPSFNPSEFCELIFTEEDIMIIHYGERPSERLWYPFRRRRGRVVARRRREELKAERALMRVLLSAGELDVFRRLAYREKSLKYEDIERIEIGKGKRFILFHIKPFLKIWSRGRIFYYKIDEGEYEVIRRKLEEISKMKGFELIER